MRWVLPALAIAIVVACGEDRPPCYHGDFIGCTCADGKYGYAACSALEDGYAACVCDGTTPGVDGGVRDASLDVAPETAKTAFLAACTTNEQCETGLCFTYGMGQELCTKPCTMPTDCPVPSTGCNGKGVCKP